MKKSKTMEQVNKVARVAEHDIDFLLLEELNSSEAFCRWFVAQTCHDIVNFDGFGAWHSVHNAVASDGGTIYGESDLILLLENSERSFALLIENKIDAVMQPNQGERYDQRGLLGISEQSWDEFSTCIVAPQLYLESCSATSAFANSISYEVIADKISEYCESGKRGEWKSYLIKEAIEQNRRGYKRVKDEAVTDFMISYWERINAEFKELRMKRPMVKPSHSDWIYLSSDDLPKGVQIVHKLEEGFVDLTVPKASHRISELKSLFNEEEFQVIPFKTSAGVRLVATKVDKFKLFETQKQACISGMRAADELRKIAHRLSGFV